MSHTSLDQRLKQAIALGILPSDAHVEKPESRPWPVVLLTALGAWLAAIPLLIVVGLLLGDTIIHNVAAPYLVGALVLTAAVLLLRGQDIPLFVEQLVIPALIVGSALLAYGLFEHLPNHLACAMLALLAGGLTWAISRPWLRVLLGAASAALTGSAILICIKNGHNSDFIELWLALHALILLWLFAMAVQHTSLNDGAKALIAAAFESFFTGWLLIALAGLAFSSGMAFLVGASLSNSIFAEILSEVAPQSATINKLFAPCSSSLALGAALLLGRSWPLLRPYAGAALILIGLAWFMPALGAVFLALSISLIAGRLRVASTAGLAAVWIIGAFYYQLSWPLANKALLFMLAGALLGALAWRVLTPSKTSPLAQTTPLFSKQKIGIALSAISVLLVANIGIWQKESLITHGQPLFVELAPSDPRSLMQGDFMRLNFLIPFDTPAVGDLSNASRPFIIMKKDVRNIATAQRIDHGEPLVAGEFKVELSPKNGRWVLVSDAWFFKEGEAPRWAAARYGEFRVNPDGKALLVGLKGDGLKPL
ncbi:GDYXXLXY domain-containing protein [Iodobacter sp. CM08]|uniref:GDYXXLXY domain-containing protein n=1 Tax=Iodobacter sp. CM08 TaxID=3085902 RepID=UPI0029824F6E|nr:GDYXXLXY domain-containing protein [Iodobacter sp. CM08]MDW5417087.1 GDYXXLXY domain-containing protein [Iodobacter sp. CM08]